MALCHINFMRILMNFIIGSLSLKVVGGEAREVKVKGVSAVLTRICSCAVIY